ncbi:MAG: Ulp1 family isopeptidase [Chlamydiales bacterium]|nr:Ulp1 family isopeptidase [Chlamydiales bacterium]
MINRLQKIVNSLQKLNNGHQFVIQRTNYSSNVVIAKRGLWGRCWDRLIGSNKLSDSFKIITKLVEQDKRLKVRYNDIKSRIELKDRVQGLSTSYYNKTTSIGRALWGHGDVNGSAADLTHAVYDELFKFFSSVGNPKELYDKQAFVDSAYALLTASRDLDLGDPETLKTLDDHAKSIFGKDLALDQFWRRFSDLGYPIAAYYQARKTNDIPTLTKLANQGNLGAMIALSEGFAKHHPSEPNDWLLKASLDSPYALQLLPDASQSLYEAGQRFSKGHNLAQSLQFFLKATELGNQEAKLNVVRFLRYGRGCKADPKAALELLRKDPDLATADLLIEKAELLQAQSARINAGEIISAYEEAAIAGNKLAMTRFLDYVDRPNIIYFSARSASHIQEWRRALQSSRPARAPVVSERQYIKPYGEDAMRLLSDQIENWVTSAEQSIDDVIGLQDTLQEWRSAVERNVMNSAQWVRSARLEAIDSYLANIESWVIARLTNERVVSEEPPFFEQAMAFEVEQRVNDVKADLDFLNTHHWSTLLDPVTGRLRNSPGLTAEGRRDVEAALVTNGAMDENWQKWLNDDCVNLMLAFLTETHENARTITVNGHKTLARFPIPINHGRSHWSVAIVDVEKGTIEHYDSMGAKAVPRVVKEHANTLSKRFGKFFRASDKSSSVQRDGYQCGTWTCFTAYNLCADPNFKLSSVKNPSQTIADFRKEMHNRFIFPLVIEQRKAILAGYAKGARDEAEIDILAHARENQWFGLSIRPSELALGG